MGQALELITALVTAPGATFTAMTVLTGDTATIRNTSKRVTLLAAWQLRQGVGNTRIVSPLLHDNVRGLQFNSGVGSDIGFMGNPLQQLYSQDTLSFSATGSATAGDIELSSILVKYDDLPGVDGNFINSAELTRRGVSRVGVRCSLTGVATGQYGTSSAINATEDPLKANTDYAIIGMTSGTTCQAVGIKSPDWGNLRVGIPGTTLQGIHFSSWFDNLAWETDMACIPVFNSSNKATTLVDFVDDENAGTAVVVLQLVELSKKGK